MSVEIEKSVKELKTFLIPVIVTMKGALFSFAKRSFVYTYYLFCMLHSNEAKPLQPQKNENVLHMRASNSPVLENTLHSQSEKELRILNSQLGNKATNLKRLSISVAKGFLDYVKEGKEGKEAKQETRENQGMLEKEIMEGKEEKEEKDEKEVISSNDSLKYQQIEKQVDHNSDTDESLEIISKKYPLYSSSNQPIIQEKPKSEETSIPPRQDKVENSPLEVSKIQKEGEKLESKEDKQDSPQQGKENEREGKENTQKEEGNSSQQEDTQQKNLEENDQEKEMFLRHMKHSFKFHESIKKYSDQLFMAQLIQESKLEELKQMIEKEKVNLEEADIEGNYPIHLAVDAGSYEIVSYLVSQKKVNINCKDKNGCTPLDLAEKKEDYGLLGLLRIKGGKSGKVNDDLFNSIRLFQATTEGNLEKVKEILNEGKFFFFTFLV